MPAAEPAHQKKTHHRPIPLLTLLTLLALCPAARAAEPDPLKSLAADWDALKNVKTISARFTCEKNLAALDTPLHSEGRLWIAKTDSNKPGSVRFSTEKPYISELILADGKVFSRSQHESDWTKTGQSSRPGLTAVMSQLGGWSTGDAAKLSEMYTVSRGTTFPPMPNATADSTPNADAFLFTPTNPDLLKAIKQITIAIDAAAHTLRYVEIVTQQGDTTRYWFYDVKINAPLPADTFKPDGELLLPEEPHP